MFDKLITGPLFWLPLTVALYLGAKKIYELSNQSPFLNPTLFAILGVVAALHLLGVAHQQYFDNVAIIHFLLGTALVALAIPLHRNLHRLSGNLFVFCASLFVIVGVSTTMGLIIALSLGATPTTLVSVAPKSSTMAVSMEIAKNIGGIAPITAFVTALAGITGAVLGPYVLSSLGIKSPLVRGLALGGASHGIGTTRAFNESELTGVWATLALGGGGIITALLVPWAIVALGINETSVPTFANEVITHEAAAERAPAVASPPLSNFGSSEEERLTAIDLHAPTEPLIETAKTEARDPLTWRKMHFPARAGVEPISSRRKDTSPMSKLIIPAERRIKATKKSRQAVRALVLRWHKTISARKRQLRRDGLRKMRTIHNIRKARTLHLYD